jgi:hypothetical protein
VGGNTIGCAGRKGVALFTLVGQTIVFGGLPCGRALADDINRFVCPTKIGHVRSK